ncbi:MAG: succinate--CoA ligase subunit alpha [Planctomycetota bacterium]|jgi:succinyl-CoA synthetase alpha subunit
MAVLVGNDTKVVVQGLTGSAGSFHAKQCIEYGTNIVAGAVPGKGGQTWEDSLPVYDAVAEAVEKDGANCSLIFVPPPFAGDAIEEAAASGVELILCVTEGIPTIDMMRAMDAVRASGARLVGPNCPGVITPGQAKIGIMPGYIHKPGRVGVVSRSGTLTYESVWQLSSRNIGQSTCIGLGGDPVNGTNFIDALDLFQADPDTDGIVLIGEIGGSAEEAAADHIKANISKPVAAFIAGATAPPGRRMGHAGALISGGKGTAAAKKEALSAAGVNVAETPAEMGHAMATLLRDRDLLPEGAEV